MTRKKKRARELAAGISPSTWHTINPRHPKSKKAEPHSNRSRPFPILDRVAIDLDFQYLKLLATDST